MVFRDRLTRTRGQTFWTACTASQAAWVTMMLPWIDDTLLDGCGEVNPVGQDAVDVVLVEPLGRLAITRGDQVALGWNGSSPNSCGAAAAAFLSRRYHSDGGGMPITRHLEFGFAQET